MRLEARKVPWGDEKFGGVASELHSFGSADEREHNFASFEVLPLGATVGPAGRVGAVILEPGVLDLFDDIIRK